MKRKSRRLLIAACIVVGVVVLLSVAVRLILTRDVLMELVVPKLETAVGAEIQVGDIGVRFPFGFGVDIRDISLEKSMPQGEVLTAGAERVVAKASLVSLIKKRPIIKSANISGGSIVISGGERVDGTAIEGLVAELSMRPAGGGFRVSADIVASTVRIPMKEKEPLILNDLGFDGDMTLDAAYQSLHIERAEAVWGELARFDISGDLSDLKTAQNVRLRIASERIDLPPLIERVVMLGLTPIAAGGEGKLIISMVDGSIGLEADIEGSIRKPSSMKMSGRVDLQEVAAGRPILQEQGRATGGVDFDMQGARSENVRIIYGSSSADIGFDVTLDGRKKIDTMHVTCVAELDLKDLVPPARRETLGMEGGSIRADIEFEGSPADLGALFPMDGADVPASSTERAWARSRLSAKADFSGIDLGNSSSPAAVSGLKGSSRIVKGDLEAFDASFDLGGSPFSCSASIEKLMPALIEMAGVLENTDPASLASLDPLFKSLKTSSLVTARIEGRSFDATPFEKKDEEPGRQQQGAAPRAAEKGPDPLAANPFTLLVLKRSTFSVRLDTIRTAKAVFTKVDAQGSIIAGQLRADPVALGYAGGEGRAVFEMDLSNLGRIESNVDLSFDKVQSAAALGAMHPLGRLLDGTFSFQANAAFESGQAVNPLLTINGNGSALSTTGKVDLSGFLSPITRSGLIDLSHLEQVDFKDWSGNFVMRNGRFVTDNWTISSNRGDWSIKGSFGIDGTLDYAVHLVVPPSVQRDMKDLSKYRDLVDLFRDRSGNLVLDLRVGGTGESPKVSLDMSAAKSKAAEGLIDKAKDWLKK